MKIRVWQNWIAAMAVAALLSTSLCAAERVRPPKYGEYNPAHETIEMFKAVANGQIAVKIIPKDSTRGTVLIENKTDKPLNVSLPETFAAVPKPLAQFGGGGAGGFGGGGMGGGGFGGGIGGAGGGRGGGMGGGGSQAMGGGMGGGMFNIPPEKIEDFKVATVCLEHGKKDPNSKIPYELKPLEEHTKTPGIHEMCKALGEGKLNQRAAQAAAWHLESGMSWQELAAKRINRANGTSEPYFSMLEVQQARRIAEAALQLAKAKEQSPGESTSTSDMTSN
jgi:hypothetical protein